MISTAGFKKNHSDKVLKTTSSGNEWKGFERENDEDESQSDTRSFYLIQQMGKKVLTNKTDLHFFLNAA